MKDSQEINCFKWMSTSMNRKIIFKIMAVVLVLLIFIALLCNYAEEYPLITNKLTAAGLGLFDRLFYYGISEKVVLVALPNIFLIFLIVTGSLFSLRYLIFIRPLRKINVAVNKIYQGELGCSVSLNSKGKFGQLANDVNRMSKKLKEVSEKHSSHLHNLKKENLFHRQVLQMILSLQTNCFSKKELPSIISHFVSMFFPEDSGALLVQSDQEKLETVAVWGADQTEMNISPHECLALWEGQVHCGPVCNSRFQCKIDRENPKIRLCIPIGRFGLLKILSDSDEHQLVTKKKWASIVAEHLGVILLGVKTDEDLRNLSLRDPLTGLFNRRFMEEALTLEIARVARQKKTLGVIMLDLDHFKRFNDTYGHLVGDALLKEMGLLLRKNCRSSDFACRYGGEEFTIIMAEADEKNIVKRVEELRVKVKNLRIWHIYQWLTGPTLSAGIAIYPYHGDTSEGLLQSADHALYRAKETGRNRICVAGEDQSQEMVFAAWPSKRDGGERTKVQLSGIPDGYYGKV